MKKRKLHTPKHTALDFIKYIGPGLLVTVGFIDPGNWAANVSAGASYGYKLLWVVTLSTIMLIILQHNAAHLGIASGYCLAEASTIYLNKYLSNFILSTAILSAISTAMAEILGACIALKMLFNIPIKIGIFLIVPLILIMLLTNSYKKLERWIIAFVSLIGLSFVFELFLVDISLNQTFKGVFIPNIPNGSLVIIMSILGSVVMPHNLFLHSEVIQSRQWNKEDEIVIKHQLKYEFYDTLFSMLIGWAINSSMIIISASVFYKNHIVVSNLEQAQLLLKPYAGNLSSLIFAISLLLAGIASCITAGISGGSIFSGIFKEPYDIKDIHSKIGVLLTLVPAGLIILFINNPFNGLIISQMLLSIQLPITILLQIYLTSSKKVMGKFKNSKVDNILLVIVAFIVIGLNIYLLLDSIL
ncbi:Nramp family divalent metal transporter [Caldicellulosiruptoraceae bacterium PP1]